MKLKLGILAKDLALYKSCVFIPGRIRTLVAMTTYSFHRLMMGKWKLEISTVSLLIIPAFQHRNAAKAAFRCGWNRRPIHWTSEKLSALSDVIYTVSHG